MACDATAWLVEKMGTQHEGPSWVRLLPGAGTAIVSGWEWTSDITEAFQCARREDAEVLAEYLKIDHFDDVSAVEHCWHW